MHRKHRLRSGAEFSRVRREGQTLAHPLLLLALAPNGRPYSRFGFAIGRRIGGAVERNRLKRRLREVVRTRIANDEVAAGWDVILIARAPLGAASFSQIEQAVGQMLRRAGVCGLS